MIAALPLIAAVTLAAPPDTTPTPMTLAQVIAVATSDAPAVRIAALRAEQARARVTESRAALLPSLSGDGSYIDRTFNLRAFGFSLPSAPGSPAIPDLIGPVTVFDARLRARQTLFDFASWVRLRAAGRSAEASRAERTAASEDQARRAALAYARAVQAEARYEARGRDVALAGELLDLAQSQVQAGVAAAIDVTRARTQLVVARGERTLAGHARERARIDLCRALGLDPATALVPADTLSESLGTSEAPDSAAALLALAESRRPELHAARARIERARLDRAANTAGRLPRLDAAADWGVSGVHPSDAFPTYDLSLMVSVPLLDGWRREGRGSELRAAQSEAEIEAGDLERRVAGEIETSQLELASAEEQIAIASQRLALANDEVDQARERFANGVAGNIEVIDAQATLLHARDAVIDARYAQLVARIERARAAGVASTLR